jgi:hypothetical protein
MVVGAHYRPLHPKSMESGSAKPRSRLDSSGASASENAELGISPPCAVSQSKPRPNDHQVPVPKKAGTPETKLLIHAVITLVDAGLHGEPSPFQGW